MRRETLRVEDLMTTAVIALDGTQLIKEAREEMRLAGIRHLPVIDRHEHVIGILSNRDVLGAPQGGRVAEVMSRHVLTVRPQTPAHEAAALMLHHKIGSLPVVGDEEQLVGVITETDFLGVARRALLGEDLHRPD